MRTCHAAPTLHRRGAASERRAPSRPPGPGSGKTVLDGSANATSAVIITGGTVTIAGFTLTKGSTSDNGAGIRIDAGSLTLAASEVTKNSCPGGGGHRGGGIYNGATLAITG